MKTFTAALIIALLPTATVAADPIRFTETLRVGGQKFTVPMALFLRPLSDTQVAVSLTSDLSVIQRNLPALLSRHIENTCAQRLSVAVASAEAEGNGIRLKGQFQAETHICRTVDGVEVREQILDQTASVETLIEGELQNGCLAMRVAES